MKRTLLTLLLFVFTGLPSAWAQAGNALTFNHAALCVRDLAASTTFYKSVLELPETPNPFNDGIHAWLTIGPQLQLHLIQRGCAVTPEKNVHLCFRVASLKTLTNRLEKLNVPYTNLKGDKQAPTIRADGVKQIYLQDPDGYWIEINDAR
ncbi:VOC family protein [Hymenobacter sp. BT188]|uniref:VOC family protein n=1 Tax=Hymenobacter sp. BT188 TaxID=2763504 RepID=UPI0016514BD4|nr:VOC family protein [Hymenobacter sp. BT188]MBC6608861.1 VOC family protein [Hymenobacter sp. BT188]